MKYFKNLSKILHFLYSTKKSFFKFDKSSTTKSSNAEDSNKEHRRNISDVSNDNLNAALNASGGKPGGAGASFKATLPYEKQREKLLICTPDQNVITKVYLPLMGYIQEIEGFMKCKPG